MAERQTRDEFIKQAISIHGNKYDYSKVVYHTSKEKISIICKGCNKEFLQTPHHHLEGHGCRSCGQRSRDYQVLSEKQLKALEYARLRKKELGREPPRITNEEFITRASKTHNNKYDYSLTKYITATDKVLIICPKHGKFLQQAYSHSIGHGCQKCNLSNGEREVSKALDYLNIPFEIQKEFPDCKDKFPLRFDFYFVFNGKKFLIEYQGIHHTKPITHFEMNGKVKLDWYKKHDAIKIQYAQQNGFVFIEVPHTEKNIMQFVIDQLQAMK